MPGDHIELGIITAPNSQNRKVRFHRKMAKVLRRILPQYLGKTGPALNAALVLADKA